MVKPNYGIDAPPVIRNLFIAGATGILMYLFCPPIRGWYPIVAAGPVNFDLKSIMLSTGMVCSVMACLMILYAKYGKMRHRDRMLAMITWRGDEQVLDIGTGRGLLMIGAAKKLTTGKSIGIDIWKKSDLTDNTLARARDNAELEGVQDKIEIKNMGAEKMDFSSATFDVILSNLCLHNIPAKADRVKACQEIARVLKPGGVALISDFVTTGLYAQTFKDAGLRVEKFGPFILTFPWLRVIKAIKK